MRIVRAKRRYAVLSHLLPMFHSELAMNPVCPHSGLASHLYFILLKVPWQRSAVDLLAHRTDLLDVPGEELLGKLVAGWVAKLGTAMASTLDDM